jgi:hypothetical protein
MRARNVGRGASGAATGWRDVLRRHTVRRGYLSRRPGPRPGARALSFNPRAAVDLYLEIRPGSSPLRR